MKKITEYQGLCEWESEIYMNNVINMNRHDREEELDEEYAIERIPRTNTPLMLIG